MRITLKAIAAALALTLALGAAMAWAQTRITVTREANTPPSVEIRTGDQVQWINASRATAHVWFFPAPLAFYIGVGGVLVRFDKPGTYEYTVHITGTETHTHSGTVVVR